MSSSTGGDVPTSVSSSTSSSSSLTPIQAARLAAEARARAPPSPESLTATPAEAHQRQAAFDPSTFKASASDKLPFHRLLDAELLPKCSKSQAVKTLEMLQTIINNILNPPQPLQASKYRQLRLSNSQVQRNLVDVSLSSPIDFLLLCSFRRTTVDFTEYLVFPSSPSPKQLHHLRIGAHVVWVVLARAREAEERETRYRQSEKEVEQERKRKAMLQFEEDRRLKMEKDDRDRLVRTEKARQAALKASAEVEAARQASENDALDHPVFTGSTSAAQSMRIDLDDGEDNGEERPPSYGSLQGRVLGTGQPVEDRTGFVQNQDLEEDDDDDYGGRV